MKKLYVKINEYNGFDDFYIPFNNKDETWADLLSTIESTLDDKYLENDKELLGLKLSLEIVDELPKDIEMEY